MIERITMKTNDNHVSKILFYFICLSSILISIITFIRFSQYDKAYLLGFIPLFYGAFSYFIKKNREAFINNLGLTILNIMMFLRYSIYILVITPSYLQEILSYDEFSLSVGLIIIEMLSVFFTIAIFYKKPPKKDNYFKSSINLPLMIPLALTIISLIVMPNATLNVLIPGSVPLGSNNTNGLLIFVYIMYDLIFFMLLISIYKYKKIDIKIKFLVSFLLMLIFVLTKISSFSSSVSRWNFLLYSIVVLYLLANMYPKYKKNIIKVLVPSLMMGILLLTVTKFNLEGNVFEGIFNPRTFDIYFNGFQGILDGIIIKKTNSFSITFSMMFNDLFSAIPIIGYPFRGLNSVSLYHEFIKRTDLILPMVSQSYIYFGVFGVGLYSSFLTFIVIKIDNIMKNTTNFYYHLSLLLLLVWISFFMGLNINIIMENTWRKVIFIIIAFLNIKISNNKNENSDRVINE